MSSSHRLFFTLCIASVLAGLFAYLPAHTVFAQETVPVVEGADPGEILTKLPELAARIFRGAVALGITLSAIVIAFGGILFILSFIRGGFKDTGMDWIKSGFTGLMITLAAWLVLYTINPGLFSFDWRKLPEILIQLGGTGSQNENNLNVITYDEIPLGKLTEQLLTGKMDCYDFDAQGNPLAGEPLKDDNGKTFLGPTYLNHDRVDCYVKLADAVEKKTLAMENLADAVSQLMSRCSCEKYGNCQPNDPNRAQQCAEAHPSQCGFFNGACKLPDNFQNNILSQDSSLACCPDNVKLQVRGYYQTHGDGRNNKDKVFPINLPYTKECDGNCTDSFIKPYYGLDEFYFKGDLNIEKKATLKKRDITYIDLDACPTKVRDCSCATGDNACAQKQPQCLQEQQKELAERQACVNNPDKTPWAKLNLIEQVNFLKNKLEQMKKSVEDDAKKVTEASQKIAQCPLVKPYIEEVKIEESKDAKATLVKTNPLFPGINAKEYCSGFAYANSQCDQRCTEMCPITEKDLGCFAQCAKPDEECAKLSGEAFTSCIEKNKAEKETCTQTCYNDRQCSKGAPFSTFKSCMAGCSNTCTNWCGLRYLPCSEEYQNCQKTCQSDSQCLQENLNSCGATAGALAACNRLKDQNVSADIIDQCIKNAYLCKNGSDQSAGYADCLISPMGATAYSSSFLYKNPQQQLCSPQYVAQNYKGIFYNCLLSYPRVAKCPVASQCPDCKCGAMGDTILSLSFEQPVPIGEVNYCAPSPGGVSGVGGGGTGFGGGSEEGPGGEGSSCAVVEKKLGETFRMVSPQCSEPAYNGDPLTFYCRQDWWKEPEVHRPANRGSSSDPQKKLVCSDGEEIPVGSTVDHSVAWAQTIMDNMQSTVNTVNGIWNIMDKLSNARNYCSCASTYESGKPICQSCCVFVPGTQAPATGPGEAPPIEDSMGSAPPQSLPAATAPKCTLQACTGNSCKQMTNYLDEITNYHRTVKSTLFDVQALAAKDGRSDILKELDYSRTKMDNASSQRQVLGITNIQILSCQQALDDIVSPITDAQHGVIIDGKRIAHSCYGTTVGKIYGNSAKTDNWFLCQTTEQSERIDTIDGGLPGTTW